MKIAYDIVHAKGHPNIRATHRSTFEITTDSYLTTRGDCIVGISADKAALHLSSEFKRLASSDNAIIVAVLEANSEVDVVVGRGSSSLTFSDDRRMVFRRSKYISEDTVMINASKAAVDIRRDLISKLKGGAMLRAILIVIS